MEEAPSSDTAAVENTEPEVKPESETATTGDSEVATTGEEEKMETTTEEEKPAGTCTSL